MTTSWDPEEAIPSYIKTLIKPSDDKLNCISAFHQIVESLKYQKRTGWVNLEIRDPESIADHMYRMSIIAMGINADNYEETVDLSKCVKISLLHDIAEALVGDIVPHDAQVDKTEKSAREYKTIIYLADLVKPYNVKFSQEMVDLWLDYEHQRNFEAKIVKDIDKYELLIQAYQYEVKNEGKVDLTEFFGAREMIKTREIASYADKLIAQREQFWTKVQKDK